MVQKNHENHWWNKYVGYTGELWTYSRYDSWKLDEKGGDRHTSLNTQNGAKIHENHWSRTNMWVTWVNSRYDGT